LHSGEDSEEGRRGGRGAMPGEYEHFWGVDWRSTPAPYADFENQNRSSRHGLYDFDEQRLEYGSPGGEGVEGRRGGWERFMVLSSRSVNAAKVCGEVLRDKSGNVEGNRRGGGGGGHRSSRVSRMGCCVVRAM